MSKLDIIRKYAETLSKASKWSNSEEAIINIDKAENEERKKEYIYEFYCILKILIDLSSNYNLEIQNNSKNNVFPKAPAAKKNYPFFVAKDKISGKVLFQICMGVDISGLADETSAPDISFQHSETNLTPTYKDVIMIFDAKFKHKLTAKVSDTEFYKVHGMIVNLSCQDAEKKSKSIIFDKLSGLNGNCLLSNGNAFKTNPQHHKLFRLKEVVHFDEGKQFKVIG